MPLAESPSEPTPNQLRTMSSSAMVAPPSMLTVVCFTDAVCAAVIPLNIFDELQMPARVAAYEKKNEAIIAEREAERAQGEREQREKFARLTPESPLADHLEYINTYSLPEAEHETSITGARRATTRQQAAVKLLQAEKPQMFVLRELWRLDIAATPELCSALNGALIKEANADSFDMNAGQYLQYQLPNMKLFADARCNLDPALDAAAARVQKIITAMGNSAGGEEWREFIDQGGYRNPTLWLSDGWAWVQEHGIAAPLYWREDGAEFTLGGRREIDWAAPVAHVSSSWHSSGSAGSRRSSLVHLFW